MAQFPTPDALSLPNLEEDVLDWWEDEAIFERSIEAREGQPTFTFYEGPPTANGKPGIHHVLARSIKDIFCRYKTMQGYQVARKAGWDTHGLPVEIEVEEELDLESRAAVEDFGIEKYNAACRESVLEYKDLWDRLTQRMGYWVDLDDPYVTFETDYIETVWWLLKQIEEKDLLYKGHKIQWYSPGSHTVLSSHEVSLGYEETQDPSVYIRFPVVGAENTYFLAWTTTPWTLISNTALAVGPDLPYVQIHHEDPHQGEEHLILAEALVDEVIDEEYTVEKTWSGDDLVGCAYEPLFDYFTDRASPGADAWHVLGADVVSTEEGTGLVHMAPAFGEEDYAVAQEHGLPLFNPIDKDGEFTAEAPLVEGMWFKDADKVITDDLKRRGRLYKHETYLHNYPHDWRKGTPLMSYPVESWFIETTALKDRMVELNDTINWQPEAIGQGRFGEWLENNVDWALSRRRYWGTPLPVWETDKEDSDYYEVIGSVEELREKCGEQLPEDDGALDLHRPYVDELTWEGPDGGTMRRVPDLIDVWFDSGAMPYAQWHYPFEKKDDFEANFPADFIAEGVDQTRGWFYSLHAIATLVFDDVAYENVVVNGLVLDEDGNKMSKSKGNTVEPFEVIDEYGADVVRWFMMSNAPPWENLRFSERGLRDLRRTFFGTLENVYSFFATYANVDDFRYERERMPVEDRTELDQWIVSRLHTTTESVQGALDEYDPTTAARAIETFVDELSNWYLRRSRARFWASKRDGDGEVGGGGTVAPEKKEAAYQTVYECLLATAKLMSPVAPFFGEWLYRTLTDGTERESNSVHLASFPEVHEAERDDALEGRMGLARTIASTTLSLRNQAEINVRQPLPRILVVTGTGVPEEEVEQVKDIILDEVNVKEIQYVEHTSDVVSRSAKPDFSRLGPRLGDLVKAVNEKVRQLDDETINRYVEEGELTLSVDGEKVTLGPEDLIVQSEGIEGWLVEQDGDVTVALDTEVTEALRAEGLAREAVKRVQNLRKDAGFDVTDRIVLTYDGSERITGAVATYADWIRNETLALELQVSDPPEGEAVDTFEIGEEHLQIGVRRVDSDAAIRA